MTNGTTRLLVCGSRNWTDEEKVYDDLFQYQEENLRRGRDLVIISGMATGADTFGVRWAHANRVPLVPFWAKWEEHDFTGITGVRCYHKKPNATRCPAAGPRRNLLMLTKGKPTLVYAYAENLPTSKGTLDMVTRARAAGVPVRHFDSTGSRWLP